MRAWRLLPVFLISLSAVAHSDQTPEGPDSQTWQPMSQEAAEAWIYDQLLWYTDGASQFFEAPSAPSSPAYTEYADGRPTQGSYTLIAGEYCSVWPPNPAWECYALEIHEDGARIRFISESGQIYEARRERSYKLSMQNSQESKQEVI